MPDRTNEELIPYDPEIEKTLRRIRREAREKEEKMADDQARAIRDFALPTTTGTQLAIRQPRVEANNFEIKPAMIQMTQTTFSFRGLPNDDPNEHIAGFLEVCENFKYNGVSAEAIRMKVFSFSLKDGAKDWLRYVALDSITT